MKLQNCPVGSRVEIISFSKVNEVTKRLNEMGILVGSFVKILRKAPFNGPIIIEYNSHTMALRVSEDFDIYVKIIESAI